MTTDRPSAADLGIDVNGLRRAAARAVLNLVDYNHERAVQAAGQEG